MQESPIIEFEHVELKFGSQIVHRDLNFSVQPGEALTILGPSGTGKTLILKLICGLIRPTRGQIRVLGKTINAMREEELVGIRAHIGMLFQGAALFDSLSVYENVAYPLRESGVRDEEKIESTVVRLLQLIGLPGIERKFPGQLSGGQKKRVGLARALSSSPKIVLFDEPTTGLDPTAGRLIDDLIVKLHGEYGITSIAVTHDIASALRISERWILIDNGVVLADGPASSLRRQNADVEHFVSGNWKES